MNPAHTISHNPPCNSCTQDTAHSACPFLDLPPHCLVSTTPSHPIAPCPTHPIALRCTASPLSALRPYCLLCHTARILLHVLLALSATHLQRSKAQHPTHPITNSATCYLHYPCVPAFHVSPERDAGCMSRHMELSLLVCLVQHGISAWSETSHTLSKGLLRTWESWSESLWMGWHAWRSARRISARLRRARARARSRALPSVAALYCHASISSR